MVFKDEKKIKTKLNKSSLNSMFLNPKLTFILLFLSLDIIIKSLFSFILTFSLNKFSSKLEPIIPIVNTLLISVFSLSISNFILDIYKVHLFTSSFAKINSNLLKLILIFNFRINAIILSFIGLL